MGGGRHKGRGGESCVRGGGDAGYDGPSLGKNM